MSCQEAKKGEYKKYTLTPQKKDLQKVAHMDPPTVMWLMYD